MLWHKLEPFSSKSNKWIIATLQILTTEKKLAGQVGHEPTPLGLHVYCSTIWATEPSMGTSVWVNPFDLSCEPEMPRVISIWVRGQDLTSSQQVTYLGDPISADGGSDKDIRSWIKKKQEVPSSCLTQNGSQGNTDSICLRKLLKIYWPQKISNNELLNFTKQDDIDTTLTRCRWKWFGHVLHRDECDHTKVAQTPQLKIIRSGTLMLPLSRQEEDEWLSDFDFHSWPVTPWIKESWQIYCFSEH